MQTVLIVINLLMALGVIGLVLLQHGKGADAGAAFGGGASSTVFGAQGAANFLSRTTAILAAGWFLTTLGLAWFAINSTGEASLMDAASPAAVEKFIPAPVTDLPDVPMDDAAAMGTAKGLDNSAGMAADLPDVPFESDSSTNTSASDELPGIPMDHDGDALDIPVVPE